MEYFFSVRGSQEDSDMPMRLSASFRPAGAAWLECSGIAVSSAEKAMEEVDGLLEYGARGLGEGEIGSFALELKGSLLEARFHAPMDSERDLINFRLERLIELEGGS